MGHDQRQRVLARGADVYEDDVQPVDYRLELRQRVQPRLGRPPVIAVGPVTAKVPQVRKRHTLEPVGNELRLGLARLPQTPPQVGQFRLGNVDQERDYLLVHMGNPMRR